MTVMSLFFCVWEGVWIIELYLNRMMFVFLIPSFFYLDSTGMAWNGMDYKDNLQNDGPSKAQILQDRQRLRVMDIYKQSCELKFSRVHAKE